MIRLGLIILEQHLDLMAGDAAFGVDLIDRELDAALFLHADDGGRTSERQHRAQFDGLRRGRHGQSERQSDRGNPQHYLFLPS